MADSRAAALLEAAYKRGQTSLSEYASKQVLAAYGIPVVREILAATPEAAEAAAATLGYPVAVKACGASLMHKSELDLVALNVSDGPGVRAAASRMLATVDQRQLEGILVQPMVRGKREIIVGGLRDKQFGPCVMLGLGSIFVEAIADVVFRLAPLDARDASEMMRELKGHRIFEAFRGEPPVDEPALRDILIATGRLLIENPVVQEVDINPLVLEGAEPVAVDALITLAAASHESAREGGKQQA
ncbi:MAG TPA: acetate--CoA ligase family protein [Candidatus Hydrogenedentes bacterium]|nr:MAG: succinyl-CoA synthetase subunit beta [Candidatus Hydrogenedentes bacterium ADurb.Bin179]HOH29813.1 acetate--CoA ligase family protein [Candidatus Hydrogenedentota bacterium]